MDLHMQKGSTELKYQAEKSEALRLSIVIVNWNTRHLLRKCLEAVYNNLPRGQMEIWVVDNASSDGSTDMVAQDFPQVRLIQSKQNLGFASANNLALRKSRAPYVLLLNPDTEVAPGALETLLRFLDTAPGFGAAGARLLNPDGSLQPSAYPRPTLFREFWRLFHLDRIRHIAKYPMAEWDDQAPREVDVLMGACLLVRREVLDRIGLFDEDFFMYSEEVDLCYRIQRGGWRLAWVPQAQVIHYGGQSTQQAAREMFLQLYNGKIKFFRKHYGSPAIQVYKLIVLLAAFVRVLLTPLAYIERPSKRQKHLVLSSHYRSLLSALPEM
jgi:GT2 family glycosyltransferase